MQSQQSGSVQQESIGLEGGDDQPSSTESTTASTGHAEESVTLSAEYSKDFHSASIAGSVSPLKKWLSRPSSFSKNALQTSKTYRRSQSARMIEREGSSNDSAERTVHSLPTHSQVDLDVVSSKQKTVDLCAQQSQIAGTVHFSNGNGDCDGSCALTLDDSRTTAVPIPNDQPSSASAASMELAQGRKQQPHHYERCLSERFTSISIEMSSSKALQKSLSFSVNPVNRLSKGVFRRSNSSGELLVKLDLRSDTHEADDVIQEATKEAVLDQGLESCLENNRASSAGWTRPRLEPTWSMRINPWQKPRDQDAISNLRELWECLPGSCQMLLVSSGLSALVMVVYSIIFMFWMDDIQQQLHTPLSLIVAAVLYFGLVGKAVLRENGMLLSMCFVLSVVLFGRTLVFMFVGVGGDGWATWRWVLVGLLCVTTLLNTVLTLLSYRKFGWRMYSRFAIDFRRSDALTVRRLWTAASLFAAVLHSAFFTTVVTATSALTIAPYADDGHIAAVFLAFNIFGIVYNVVLGVIGYQILRDKRKHKFIIAIDLLAPFTFACPIVNIVYMWTKGESVHASRSTLTTLAIMTIAFASVAWILVHLIQFWWNRLADKSQIKDIGLDSSSKHLNITASPDIAPLLKGAWLGKPSTRSSKKKRFFQLAHDLNIIRWSWRKWIDLHYVDSVVVRESCRTMRIKLTAEPDLVLLFPDQELLNKWRLGLMAVLKEVLGGVEWLESEGEGLMFSKSVAKPCPGGLNSSVASRVDSTASRLDSLQGSLGRGTSRKYGWIHWMEQTWLYKRIFPDKIGATAQLDCIAISLHEMAAEEAERQDSCQSLSKSGSLEPSTSNLSQPDPPPLDSVQYQRRAQLERKLTDLGRKHRYWTVLRSQLPTVVRSMSEALGSFPAAASSAAASSLSSGRQHKFKDFAEVVKTVMHIQRAARRRHSGKALTGTISERTETPSEGDSAASVLPPTASGGFAAYNSEGIGLQSTGAFGSGLSVSPDVAKSTGMTMMMPMQVSEESASTAVSGGHGLESTGLPPSKRRLTGTDSKHSLVSNDSRRSMLAASDSLQRQSMMEAMYGHIWQQIQTKSSALGDSVVVEIGDDGSFLAPSVNGDATVPDVMEVVGDAMCAAERGGSPFMVIPESPATAGVPAALAMGGELMSPFAAPHPALVGGHLGRSVGGLTSSVNSNRGPIAQQDSSACSPFFGFMGTVSNVSDTFAQRAPLVGTASNLSDDFALRPPTLGTGSTSSSYVTQRPPIAAQDSTTAFSPFAGLAPAISNFSDVTVSELARSTNSVFRDANALPTIHSSGNSMQSQAGAAHVPWKDSQASPQSGASFTTGWMRPSSLSLGSLQPSMAFSTSTAGSAAFPIPVEVIERSELQLIQRIGAGAQGEVWKAKYRDTDVAVKVFKDVVDDPESATRMLHEIRMHLGCGTHDNIVGVRGICNAREEEIWLVLEFCPRGALENLLMALSHKERTMQPCKLLEIVRSIARGLLHLHSRNILHRDIKPYNILVSYGQLMKLADFGHACFVSENGPELPGPNPLMPDALQWGPATPNYAAPELCSSLHIKPPIDPGLILKADIYSFGVLLWQLLTNLRPYHGVNPTTVMAWHLASAYENLKLPPIKPPPNCIPEVAAMYNQLGQLVVECMQLAPEKRPDIRAVVATLKKIKISSKAVKCD